MVFVTMTQPSSYSYLSDGHLYWGVLFRYPRRRVDVIQCWGGVNWQSISDIIELLMHVYVVRDRTES